MPLPSIGFTAVIGYKKQTYVLSYNYPPVSFKSGFYIPAELFREQNNMFPCKKKNGFVDGKAIKFTVSDTHNSYQNFVCLISLFSQKREQIIYADKFESKEKSNQPALLKTIKDTAGKFDAVNQFPVTEKKQGERRNTLNQSFQSERFTASDMDDGQYDYICCPQVYQKR